MARRTLRDVELATIVSERAGVLALRRERVRGIQRQLHRKQISEADAAMMIRLINTFADDIAIGLRVTTDHGTDLRTLMRPIAKADLDERKV